HRAAHHCDGPCARRAWNSAASYVARDLAGQCCWSLPAQTRSVAGADRSKLSGHGSLCDQSRGSLSLPDHSSGSLSLAQSPECLATSPYPFLGVRSLSALAPGDADVLSRRPTARARSHLQWRANRAGTTAPARLL